MLPIARSTAIRASKSAAYIARARKSNASQGTVEVRVTIKGCGVRPDANGDAVATVREAVEHLLPEVFQVVECHETEA